MNNNQDSLSLTARRFEQVTVLIQLVLRKYLHFINIANVEGGSGTLSRKSRNLGAAL